MPKYFIESRTLLYISTNFGLDLQYDTFIKMLLKVMFAIP